MRMLKVGVLDFVEEESVDSSLLEGESLDGNELVE